MQLGWIDFSKKDRDKTSSVLQLFGEKGAIDELGIGTVRDAFANFFFPGTSTIQTRAKYFFIVSYLLQETAAANKGLDWLGIREKECCRRLVEEAELKGEPFTGIIGHTQLHTKAWIKRKPSDIYWNGIKTLGFFNPQFGDLSMTEYLHQAQLIAKEKANLNWSSRRSHDQEEDADDNLTLGGTFHKFWEIKPETGWLDSLTIKLNAREASFFTETLQKHYPNSVFNILLKNWPGCEMSFPSVVELVKNLVKDDRTRLLLDYALEFDQLVYSARVAYNVILSDGTNETASKEWSAIEPKLTDIAKIDINKIFYLLSLDQPGARRFLEELVKLYKEEADFELIKDRLIRREQALKGPRAKLLKPSAEYKDKWIGGGHLDYRTPNACQIIKDIKNHV